MQPGDGKFKKLITLPREIDFIVGGRSVNKFNLRSGLARAHRCGLNGRLEKALIRLRHLEDKLRIARRKATEPRKESCGHKPENVSSAGTLRHAPDDSQHTPAARHNRTQRNFRCRAGPRRPLLRSQSQHFPLVATSWESVSSQSRLSEERPTLSRKRVGGPKATGKAAGVFCL